MLVAVEINIFQLAGERTENHRQIGEPFDIFYSRKRRRLLLGELVALPDGEVFVWLAEEKNLALVRIKRVRREQQHRFLLMDAGEIK